MTKVCGAIVGLWCLFSYQILVCISADAETFNNADSSSFNASLSTTESTFLVDQRLLGVNGTDQGKPTPSNSSVPDVVKAIKGTPVDELDQDRHDDEKTITGETEESAKGNKIAEFKEEYFVFYNSTNVVDQERVSGYWDSVKNLTVNDMLSNSHRRAITVGLKFDFPYYGQPVRNVTVASGGFLYTGEYINSWLASTQYVAPLMANFDGRLSNSSLVRFDDNGTAFTVLWENVSLQDKQDVGQFTFSVTLHESGDIVFVYYSLPVLIPSIQDDEHPVKIGLSDAYMVDKTIYFARRKTIYEYHRITLDGRDIFNNTVITLTANPSCYGLTDCEKCVNFDLGSLFRQCYWCPTLRKCSSGTDRKRQEWIKNACHHTQISDAGSCPAITTETASGVTTETASEVTTETASGVTAETADGFLFTE